MKKATTFVALSDEIRIIQTLPKHFYICFCLKDQNVQKYLQIWSLQFIGHLLIFLATVLDLLIASTLPWVELEMKVLVNSWVRVENTFTEVTAS